VRGGETREVRGLNNKRGRDNGKGRDNRRDETLWEKEKERQYKGKEYKGEKWEKEKISLVGSVHVHIWLGRGG
jgi:hypothetical protein